MFQLLLFDELFKRLSLSQPSFPTQRSHHLNYYHENFSEKSYPLRYEVEEEKAIIYFEKFSKEDFKLSFSKNSLLVKAENEVNGIRRKIDLDIFLGTDIDESTFSTKFEENKLTVFFKKKKQNVIEIKVE